ncbi:CNP1-like family protein [Noviherbaspirillum pedocola]|uniref:CNP1-like family protein n=1 Tax=Noviherbaspirillum pedocola TaxID=2801341 RepID=A0A934SVE6_9BURK|nr:CNP1-like family protein [Noviherbaspirillum pedocola]MBK4733502.1 CNP1-like family protein [Noviherbaspirillum pedocola]
MLLNFCRIATACALAVCASASWSQSHFEEDFDDVEKPWQEVTVQMPAAPIDANLLPFDVSATATLRFAVDANSLSVGSDGVVRYTLVAVSPSGAKSISYEGIRCATFEKKTYAFGHPDGTWSRSRRDQWEPIPRNSANRQHAVLAQDFLCDGKTVAGNKDQMLRRLRTGQSVTPTYGA